MRSSLRATLLVLLLGACSARAQDARAPEPALEDKGAKAERREETLAGLKVAARAAAEGNLASARAGLDALPQGDALPQARFLRACIALEAQQWQEADTQLEAARKAEPGRVEPRLLKALLELRREQPAMAWREASVRAWEAVGRPELKGSAWLVDDTQAPQQEGLSLEEAWSRTWPEDIRRVMALATPGEERARFLFQSLSSIQEEGQAVAARNMLRHEALEGRVRTEAAPGLRAMLSRVARSSPNSQQLHLALLLGDTAPTEPFTPQELEALEAVSTLPEWRTADFHAGYEYALARLRTAGLADAEGWAFTYAVSTLSDDGHVVLGKRAKASLGTFTPAQAQRLGEALWRIGSRMVAESTLLERMVGTALMRQGAETLGDEARVRAVEAMRRETREAMRAWEQAAARAWPLASLRRALQEDMLREEWETMRAFSPAR